MMRVLDAERAINLANTVFVARMMNGEDAWKDAQKMLDAWQAIAAREPLKKRRAPPIPRHLLPMLGIELEEPTSGHDEHR